MAETKMKNESLFSALRREKEQLEKMWSNNDAPWKIWK